MAWTEERRKRQADLCRQIQPWRKSIGPKTPRGKAVVSMNAYGDLIGERSFTPVQTFYCRL